MLEAVLVVMVVMGEMVPKEAKGIAERMLLSSAVELMEGTEALAVTAGMQLAERMAVRAVSFK
jgi:hypothetical protein